jgi:hypothetical protein
MPWINLTLRRGSLPKSVQHAVGKINRSPHVGSPLISSRSAFRSTGSQADYAARALVAEGFKRYHVGSYPSGATIGVCQSLF